jgi:hypothetical protein
MLQYGPFTVYLADGTSRAFPDEEAQFEVHDSGVLEVKPQKYGGVLLYFSPSGWLLAEVGEAPETLVVR